MADVTSTASLRMLIGRLAWPVRFVRWRAAREYASILSCPKLGADAANIFLEWLGARKLESEIVTGLSVLICADPVARPPAIGVIERIGRPSILSDALLSLLYGPEHATEPWRTGNSGSSPIQFVAEPYFGKHNTACVPPILKVRLEKLEQISGGIPLAQQWSYEWQQLVDRYDAPRSSYPYYFVDFSEHQSGIDGQFSQRQCDFLRSAYLRTLSYAVDVRRMPMDIALDSALLTLPLNPGLARIDPISRPTALGDRPEKLFQMEGASEQLVQDLMSQNAHTIGMQPISLTVPVDAGVNSHAEIRIRALLASDDFQPDSAPDAVFEGDLDWKFQDGMSFAGVLPQLHEEEQVIRGQSGHAIPLAVRLYPRSYGFWMLDYFHVGISAPSSLLLESDVAVSCLADRIGFLANEIEVGNWKVWHDHWSPRYIRPDGNTRCGTITEASSDALKARISRRGRRLAWVVETREWKQESDHGPYRLHRRMHFFKA
ncbi:hypothetical protein [Hyphomicrobium sp. D-2]|uniref:hypothetical protein n=1 Tax=Hyphomicrobium sp. D-2 TaxID=3041621 RepID=UPI002457B605|nr:hypothetical protein [Hyphomicrobium sp. D-2]MDH4982169.1 hypothetical protein [Hyphomicrobium sp. D-2]